MKALVVDDDVVSRMALMDLLAGFGMFDLIEADDGEAAWDLLEAGLRPVICFCDVRMPRLSGIDLLQRLRTLPALAEMPFVLVSSASDRDTVLAAVKLGAIGYIVKPFQAAEARVQLGKIFKVTLDKLAEDPGTTLKRLNINPDRLQAYLAAFQGQLEAGVHEVAQLMAGGDAPTARLRIDSLHTGCVTLGLWRAAAQLDLARAGALNAPAVNAALGEAVVAVLRQVSRVRASVALADAGARA